MKKTIFYITGTLALAAALVACPPATDTTPPTVSLSSSTSNVVLPGSIKLTATASDDVGVSKIEFYDGTTKLGEDSSVPFEQNVDLARANNGAKSYSAKAFDAANNSASSAAVAVTVNIPEILPPTGTPAAKGDVVDAVSSLAGRSQGVQTSVTTQTNDYYKELNLSSLHVPGQAPVTVLQVFGQMADSAAILAQNGFDSRALADKITNMASKVASSTRTNTLSKLPTGDYDCTTAAATCPNNDSTSSDLKVTWKTLSNKTAIAIIDWDGSSTGTASAPAEIINSDYNGNISKVQLPTKAVANVTVDGKVVLKAQFQSEWESSSWTYICCGGKVWGVSINNMSFTGTLFTLDGTSKLIDVSKFKYSRDTAGLKTSGDISIALNDPYHVKWDINLGGITVTRTTDYPNGIGSGIQLSPLIPYDKVFTPKGALGIALNLEIGTKAYAFETKATDWTYNANGGIVSLDGITGSFAADNKLVTFAGKLDGVDANKNCIPFENLNLTFSEGTVTLEQFLIDRFPTIFKSGNCP
jgi:Bacterial Ig domain